MKCCVNKFKILSVILLVVVLAGMFVLGFVGLNQTVDYKQSYEIQVGIEQNIKGSVDVVKKASESYFSQKGIKITSYATQTLNDGATVIYKADSINNFVKQDLLNAVKNALSSTEFSAWECTVNAYKTDVVEKTSLLYTLIALGVSAVLIFIYALVAEKLATAVATLCSGVISALVFVSLIALLRISASPTFWVMLSVAFVLGSAFGVAMSNRFKETMKLSGNEKLSSFEIASVGAKMSMTRFWLLLISGLIVGIGLIVLGFVISGYFANIGYQVVVAVVSALLSALTFTPIIWACIKKTK